ncbi:MAG: hypothetical protein KJ011_03310 [Burkholderiaceae bacterium]|nr:hypothetical protein [Burkholderiaceae bacterium]
MRSSCASSDGAARIEARIRAEATRSLQLLKAIEDTVANVSGVDELLRVVASGAHALAEGVSRTRPNREIDPDDELVRTLEAGQQACERLLGEFRACAAAARADTRLTEEDGVAEAYDAASRAVCDAHDALGEAVFAIQQHDGLASGTSGGPFESADELIAHLRS